MDASQSSTLSDTSHDTPSTGPPAGAIAGGVIGGLVVLGLIALFFFLLGKRRQNRDIPLLEYKQYDYGEVAGGTAPWNQSVDGTESNGFLSATSASLISETRGKAYAGQVHAEANPTMSSGNSQSQLHANNGPEDEDEMTSQSWTMAPPAYDQVV